MAREGEMPAAGARRCLAAGVSSRHGQPAFGPLQSDGHSWQIAHR
jgi:hypothetical protein